jgi:hypothetical protein
VELPVDLRHPGVVARGGDAEHLLVVAGQFVDLVLVVTLGDPAQRQAVQHPLDQVNVTQI